MGASRLRMLWDVVVPSAHAGTAQRHPHRAGAVVHPAGVSSELIVAQKGFGYLIGLLGANGSYDAMYAVVLTVAFLGFAADRALPDAHEPDAAMARTDAHRRRRRTACRSAGAVAGAHSAVGASRACSRLSR